MSYSFSIFNRYAKIGLATALCEQVNCETPPVIVCIGSDLALGDSLGPLTGTLLQSQNPGAFIYGTLKKPVTAKEVKYINDYISMLHPKSSVIAVDAAIGESTDIGLIKLYDGGIKPGLGAQKDLCKVGDISILGIVAVKSFMNYSLLNGTRLNMIYSMAEIISDALSSFICSLKEQRTA